MIILSKILKMKNLKTIGLILALLSPFISNAQITEKSREMSLGVQNAFIVDLPDTDDDMITSEWKAYLKEYGKVKRNRKAKEYHLMEESIESIHGEEKMDIYMKREDNQMMVFFDIGGQFLDDSHEDHENAIKFLEDFILEVQKSKIEIELANEENHLKKFEKNLSTLEKDNNKYHSKIEDAKKTIKKNKNRIETNESDQKRMNKTIQEQKDLIENIKDRLNSIGS